MRIEQRTVTNDVFKLGMGRVIFVDPRAEIDGSHYCNLSEL